MEALSTSRGGTPANAKIMEYVSCTLHHGRTARDSIKEVSRQAKYIMEASTGIFFDDDELKDNLMSATAEAEIAMAFNIKAAIKKLEYCSKVLTKLCTESPVSVASSNTKYESFSTKPNSPENPTKNTFNPTPLLTISPSQSPDQGRPSPDVREEENDTLVIGSQLVSDNLHSVNEMRTLSFTSEIPSSTLSMRGQPHTPVIFVLQNPSYLPLTTASEGFNSESHLRTPKVELQDENPLLSEPILEAHPVAVNLEEKLKNLLDRLPQQKKESTMVENQTSQSEIKLSTSRFPKPRGWEAKKLKLMREGIEVDKCPICKKFKRSAAAGKNMGRCRCLKREKVPQEVVRLKSQIDTPEDRYTWRKYGQKLTKRESNPRSYYKCTMSNKCPAKKHTERDMVDPEIVIVTYSGEHNHNMEVKKGIFSRAYKKSRLNPKDRSPKE